MKRRDFIKTSTVISSATLLTQGKNTMHLTQTPATPKIFITGGSTATPLMKFYVNLTGKQNPKICLLPTASADSERGIIRWYERARELGYDPYVQRMFISSYNQQQDFRTVLMDMDAIWVSGGNTLNMIAIWKAQGIDKILYDAWQQGIVMGGGSAGSICWFEQGVTDSRPIELTAMDALGFLPGSHCPHYDSEGPRKGSYFQMIREGRLTEGYALDDEFGLYFEGKELKKMVSTGPESEGYFVSLKDGEVVEELLKAEVLGN